MDYITLENISKSYQEQGILNEINFSLKEGEIGAILGRSGVGKTTIFNILAGFEKADSGTIFLKDTDITHKKKEISYMTQKHLLLPYFNILDNICLSLTLKHTKKKVAYEKALPLLDKFGLAEHQKKYPHELSGGMKQRVSFLRAYLKESDLMLFDEPFSALDSITKQEIYKWFLEMTSEERKTTIFITHDIQEAIYLSDRIFVLDGRPANVCLNLEIKKPEKIETFRNSKEFFAYYDEIMKLYE